MFLLISILAVFLSMIYKDCLQLIFASNLSMTYIYNQIIIQTSVIDLPDLHIIFQPIFPNSFHIILLFTLLSTLFFSLSSNMPNFLTLVLFWQAFPYFFLPFGLCKFAPRVQRLVSKLLKNFLFLVS